MASTDMVSKILAETHQFVERGPNQKKGFHGLWYVEICRMMGELFSHGMHMIPVINPDLAEYDIYYDEFEAYDGPEDADEAARLEHTIGQWIDYGPIGTEPGTDWSPAQRALCYKLVGDLCILRGDDHALGHAYDIYNQFFELEADLPVEIWLLAIARFLRADYFGLWSRKYSAKYFREQLTQLSRAFELARGVDERVRWELELSFLDAVAGIASSEHGTDQASFARSVEMVGELFKVGRPVFIRGLDDDVPFRQSVGWLAAGACLSPKFGLSDEAVAPLLKEMMVTDRVAAQLLCARTAMRIHQDQADYPAVTGGYYVKATYVAPKIKLDVADQLGDDALRKEAHEELRPPHVFL